MESSALKRDFGKDITFWGGLVDTQGVFTNGTEQQVRDEVRRRIDDFGAGGGFIAATVHNVQANVPPQNVMAMWETLQEYGNYGPGGVGQRPGDYVYSEPLDKPLMISTSPDAMPARALTPEEAAAMQQAVEALPPVILTMREAIVEGDLPDSIATANQALSEDLDAQYIILNGVVPAMEVVGQKFEEGEYFLPEMMAAALGTRGILDILSPYLTKAGTEPVGKAIIATVKGDLHDIGKNMVCMMLEGAGYEIIDLGVDVPPEKFVEAIQESDAQLLGLSALLTTTMPMMRNTIQALENAGVRDQVKVMVGGAGVTQEFADNIGADGYAPDASAAVRKARDLLAASA
jgi:5-methyltetrahydrofolate--homocysteine methyltransferase